MVQGMGIHPAPLKNDSHLPSSCKRSLFILSYICMHSPEKQTLYNKRSGIDIQDDLETVLAAPEVHLSDAEHQHLQEFALGLLNGSVEGIECTASGTLEAVFHRSIAGSQESFYTGYFVSPEGRQDSQLLGESNLPETLTDLPYMRDAIGDKTRKEMAARSRDWYKQQIADALLRDPAHDRAFHDENEMTVSYDPDVLLDKFDDLQKYRSFYREVKRKLKETDRYTGHMGEAEEIIVDRYFRRVNGLVAELYPSVFALAEQLQRSKENDTTAVWRAKLAECAPVVAHLYDSHISDELQYVTERTAFNRFAERLDTFRNGAEYQEGGFSPVSQEIVDYAAKDHIAPENLQPELPVSTIEQLDKAECDATQLAQLCEAVLREWNLLSQESATWEEVDARSNPALDGLYQVIVTPKQKSLAVDSVKKVVYVPQSFRRTFTQASPAGALLVCAHELAHVQQAEFDETLGRQIPLARIKGRQSITLREAGGKYQERQILERYLGRSYSPNAHYLKALQAKLAGGNVVEVARAFYNSHAAQNNPAHDPKKAQSARELAADRVLRLYRFGGHNSQPLNYIEQELIVDRLSEMNERERAAFLLAAGSFNVSDAAMLRKIGMLEIPSSATVDPADDVMQLFMRDFYDAWIS